MSSTQAADREMTDRVREVLARALEVPLEGIAPDASQGNLERWDSLGHLNVVMELEAAFGVSFSTDEAVGMRSVAGIVKALKGHAMGR